MRLLNAATFRLESVTPDFSPRYAVLSHRWTSDEVSFREIHTAAAKKKPAFDKIRKCCEVAQRRGLSHVWIDACCIDQSSSAELSEAINSMFRWYQNAKICFAYLHDAKGKHDFTKSDWFNRGWTLQELIAPRIVEFYSGEWELFGDKTSLSAAISAKTGIASRYLQGGDMELASVAERMSWVAERQTSRPEDIVYCLLGIFDIHMPLLYGEGEQKAFARLHSELILQTPDLSWLAWSQPTTADRHTPDPGTLHSVFAPSPSYFRDCRDIVCVDPDSIGDVITETNIGIEIRLRVVKKGPRLYGLLNCQPRGNLGNVIAIPLVDHGVQYYRSLDELHLVTEEIWSQHEPSRILLSPRTRKRVSGLHEDIPYYFAKAGEDFRIVKVFPAESWEPPGVVNTKPSDQAAIPASVRVVQLLFRRQHFVLVLWEGSEGGPHHRRHFLGALPKTYSLASTTLEDVALAIGQGTPQKWFERIRKQTNEPSPARPDGLGLVVRLENRKVFNRPVTAVDIAHVYKRPKDAAQDTKKQLTQMKEILKHFFSPGALLAFTCYAVAFFLFSELYSLWLQRLDMVFKPFGIVGKVAAEYLSSVPAYSAFTFLICSIPVLLCVLYFLFNSGFRDRRFDQQLNTVLEANESLIRELKAELERRKNK